MKGAISQMIVGHHIEQIEVPHELGNYFKIRELSGLELDEAELIKSQSVMRNMATLGRETIDMLRDPNTAQTIRQADVNPKEIYDWRYVIEKAVVEWSGPLYDSVECTDDNKKQLDKVTLDWIVGEILTRNTIPLVKSITSEGYSTEVT